MGAGRPRLKIPWEQIEGLCAIFCTLEEISAVTKLSQDTIERACVRDKSMNFAEFFKRHSATGRHSLRRQQFKLAEEGDRVMLIWLGKQHLGQRDSFPEEKSDSGMDKIAQAMAKLAEELKGRDG